MPRFRLAFTVNPGQPRGMINAAWLSLLPGPAALMMMDRVSGRLWSRRLAQAAGRPLRPRLSLTRGLCRNLGMITLTGVTGHCGGCVPLPPSCGCWVPQPPLPAGTASVTIQRCAAELRGEPVFSLTSGVPHSPQAEPRRPGDRDAGLRSGGRGNPPSTRLAVPADWLPEPGSGVASAAGRVKRGPVRPGWPRAGGQRRWRRSPG